MRTLFALLLCCIAPSLLAAPITRINATYDVFTRGIKIAEITETFVRTRNRYRIESITKPVGLLAALKPDRLTVVSEGDITAKGLRPQAFTYKRSKEAQKNSEDRFDWKQATVTHTDSLGQRSDRLPADAQDRLSMLYQFSYLDNLTTGKELTAHISDGRNLNTRVYAMQSKQPLTVPFGTLDALYLSTTPQKTAWKTEIWLSPKDSNFPCKIAVTEDNGDQITQVLTTLSIVR